MVDGKMNRVLYEDNHILVVEKPCNMPVQGDSSGDLNLLTSLKSYIKDKYNKPGNVYLGLVHRLDRPVGGIMVFARTSKAAERLSKDIVNNEVDKYYLAVVCGILNEKNGTMEDYLLKDEKTNTTRVDSSGKYAKLEYEVLNEVDGLSLVKVHLITGRSHQIRVQFASRNLPLWGDNKYNKKASSGKQIALWSHELSFNHPITKERLTFKSLPKNEYPWNLFMKNVLFF